MRIESVESTGQFGVRGMFVENGLVFRDTRVKACLAISEPVWEKVTPPGYVRVQERCSRCKTLRIQHRVRSAP